MATRRDEWLVKAAQHDPSTLSGLLAELDDVSGAALEGRWLALMRLPGHDPKLAKAALAFFVKFPVRFREQMGTAVAALGVAWKNELAAGALKKVKAKKAPNPDVTRWLALVPPALAVAVEHRAHPPKDGGGPAESTALPAKPRATLQAAWLKRAGRRALADLPSLLETLQQGPATDVTERLVTLLSFAPDQRIADAAATLLERPMVRVSPEVPLYSVAALLLCLHGDGSHQRAVTKLVEQVQAFSWLEFALPCEKKRSAAPKAPRGSSAPKDETGFLRFIAEAPGDDARVALFTDWALEQGLPLGEFMALQRAGRELKPKEQKRVTSLLGKNEKTWLGPLARAAVKGTARFRVGVLRELHLSVWKGADLPKADEPRIATVETLTLQGGTNLLLGEVVHAGWMSLRSLTSTVAVLEALPAVVRERLEEVGVEEDLKEQRPLALFARHAFPKVKSLRLVGQWWGDPKTLESLPGSVKIAEVLVQTTKPSAWLKLASRLQRLEVVPGYEPEHHFTFRFEEGRLRAVSCPAPHDLEKDLFALLEELPVSVRRGAVVEGGVLPAGQQARFDAFVR